MPILRFPIRLQRVKNGAHRIYEVCALTVVVRHALSVDILFMFISENELKLLDPSFVPVK